MGQIERLEIENFKSYGKLHTIGPFRRFTAVIGPNGAGKSNLMDAISFVLGVQSRHLRSTGLKELIFKVPDEGPQRRKASVTLVYVVSDNEVPGMDEGDELVFTRLISPNGVGSYRLNGNDVTWEKYEKQLKDINILVKARNFLVFQGDVESIASKKPEEMTKLFEQISGSEDHKDEYDRLREEKERAENETVESFQRRKQLVNEKKAVKEQKEEAERFNTKLEELNELKRTHFLWQLFHIEEDYKGHDEQLQKLKEKMDALNGKEKAANDQYHMKKKELSKSSKGLSELEKRLSDQRKKRENAQNPTIQLEEAIKHAGAQIKSATSSYERISTDNENQQQEINALLEDIERIKEAEAELDQTSAVGSVHLEESQRQEYNRIKSKARSATSKLRAELDTVLAQNTADEERLKTLKLEDGDREAKREDLLKQEKELSDRQAKVSQAIKTAEDSLKEHRKQLSEIQEQHEANQLRRNEIKAELTELQQSLRDAKDERRQNRQDQRMQEIQESLKRLFPGVKGRLVDLCKPTHRKYNLAVTVATGKHMDSFVVTDKRTAMDCIQYLRDQRLGTASFLPLSSLKVKSVNERLRTISSRIKLVQDIIDCDPETKVAVQYAVSNTVVCETLDDARDLCFNKGEKVKAVTLAGAVISKSGMMTGGTTSRDTDRASRWDEKEVQQAKQRKEQLQKELVEIERAIFSGTKNRLQELTNKINGFENRVKFGKADLTVTRTNLKNIEGQLKAMEEQLRQCRPTIHQVETAISSRESKINSLQRQVNEIEDRLYADFSAQVGVSSIREYEESALKQQEERANARRQLTVQKSKLEAKAEYLKSRDLTDKLSKLEKKIKSEKKQLAKLEKEHAKLQEEITNIDEEIDTLEGKLKDAKAKSEAIETEAKAFGKERTKILKEKNALAKEISTQEAELEKLRSKRHEVLQKAVVDEVSLPLVGGGTTSTAAIYESRVQESEPMDTEESESAPHFSQPVSRVVVEDAAQASKIDFSGLNENLDVEDEVQYNEIHSRYLTRISELSAEIEQMQPDMKAPERYADVQQRLRSSYEDLDKIKEAATEAALKFEEVKNKRIKAFMACFDHVSGIIDQIYKDLTRSTKHQLGGTASLLLENPEEPYNGGIKFNAMPPMKRFRDMEQLSGGEKTVAALALLFSIHSFHPSPFFVLDEVDAALDNVNVNKVSNYIKERSSDFQCVVISLKDSFYEKADGLVGICREKRINSSRTLTLDLTAYDRT